MIYFTSDLHFYHDKIIPVVHRPFANAEEMNRSLIQNWNHSVKETDQIYILGDVTMKGAEYANEALKQLNGRKYLIKGNHDRFVQQQAFDQTIFEWVKEYYELNDQNDRFILFHYPIAEWNHYFRGSYHLHGHQHNHASYNETNRKQGLLRYDVGVDANDMAPVSIETIREYFVSR